MAMVKVRQDGNSAVITVPREMLEKARLAVGEYVWIVADEETGHIVVAPVRPRTRHEILEVARDVVERNRDLYERLARYDRGE